MEGPCAWGLMVCDWCLEILNFIFEFVFCKWSLMVQWSTCREGAWLQRGPFLRACQDGFSTICSAIPWCFSSHWPALPPQWMLLLSVPDQNLNMGVRRVSNGITHPTASWGGAWKQLSCPGLAGPQSICWALGKGKLLATSDPGTCHIPLWRLRYPPSGLEWRDYGKGRCLVWLSRL